MTHGLQATPHFDTNESHGLRGSALKMVVYTTELLAVMSC